MNSATKRFGPVLVAACISAVIVSCSDSPRSPLSPTDDVASFAKSTAVTVKAADPAFGDQGQTNEPVTITGTGFKADARVAFLHNGQADPTIVVSSVQVVSSTTIVATIDIGANSPVDFRDVQVTNFSDRTPGIGASLFEVTQAHIISGTTIGRGVNDNGEMTGELSDGTPFYYNVSTGFLQTISTVQGSGFAISQRGDAIAGGGVNGNGLPFLYTRTGGAGTAWTATSLPIGSTATGGTANAMVTDPVTGAVTLIGGFEKLPIAKGAACTNAIIWSRQASSGAWQRNVLPKAGGCGAQIRARGLSANGTAVGTTGAFAAVWIPDGAGGYTLTQLTDGRFANGINADASIIVGETAATHSIAVYWRASGGGWASATPFGGSCTSSRDVADVSGRATLNTCSFSGTSVTYASYIDPPYTTVMRLGSVGGHNNNYVGALSPSGNYMVGYGVTSGNVQVGVYWHP